MTYQIQINSESNTYKSPNVDSLDTQVFTSIREEVISAFKDINEIDDILFDKNNLQVNLKIILKTSYSNDLLFELSKRQLIILEKLPYFLFSFDYFEKNNYQINDNEVSILNSYARS